MPKSECAESTRPLRLPPIRLRQRRLFQGCALLLLIPTAAAFLPVQGRAPQPTLAMIPVDTSSPTAAPSSTSGSPFHLASLPVHAAPKGASIGFAPVRTVAGSSLAPARKQSRLSGIASWYGNVLRGHRTASGERFDPAALTACHPTLPFGTLVRVINLINHRSVIVRITDRGILSPNRVIDLSSAAALELDMLRTGVAPVRLEIESILHGPPVEPEESKTVLAQPPAS